MRQLSLDSYGNGIQELPVEGNAMGECEICGRLACVRPVIYNGRRMQLHFECIMRILKGYPMLEPV